MIIVNFDGYSLKSDEWDVFQQNVNYFPTFGPTDSNHELTHSKKKGLRIKFFTK